VSAGEGATIPRIKGGLAKFGLTITPIFDQSVIVARFGAAM